MRTFITSVAREGEQKASMINIRSNICVREDRDGIGNAQP